MRNKKYFSTSKVLLLSLLSLLLISFLLISGCTPISNLLFGSSGSIEVTTYPSGAKIFLNGNDTGYVTPYTITNLIKGTYEVKVTLGDISYSKTVIVYSDSTTSVYKDLLPRLNKVIVQPTSMSLKEGESQKVDSVTAYYIDSGSVNLTLSDCIYSSSSSHATVNSSGTVTGVSEGSATITISYTDVQITKTDTVDITISPFVPPPVVTPVVYRAFLIGVGDYVNYPPPPDGDLSAPIYDVMRMALVFDNCKFGESESTFSIIDSLVDHDATKNNILQGIANTFSGADDNDISYFYFSGHGLWDLSTSYICPTDTLLTSYDNDINVNELESALSNIPGTKVVILDSCFSGGFIGKGKEEKNIFNNNDSLIEFNNNVIDVFIMNQTRDLLATSQYKVLTSAHYDQPCEETSPHPYDGFPFGIFTAAFCNGCGYDDGVSYADSNSNKKITLDELYEHIRNFVIIYFGFAQNVQVFPENSDFTIVEN